VAQFTLPMVAQYRRHTQYSDKLKFHSSFWETWCVISEKEEFEMFYTKSIEKNDLTNLRIIENQISNSTK